MRKIAFFVLALAISSCESIETPDGKIPEQYVSLAQNFVGTFHGEFDSRPATLSISLEDRKPVLAYHDESGSDLLGKDCGSSIGKLNRIFIFLSDTETKFYAGTATFEFNPGKCVVQGRELTVGFRVDEKSKVTKIMPTIVRDSVVVHDPEFMICHRDDDGMMKCDTIPEGSHSEDRYFSGTFYNR